MRADERIRVALIALAALVAGAQAARAQDPAEGANRWLYPVVRHARIGAIDAAGRDVIPTVYETLDGLTIENWPQFPRVGDIVSQWSGWAPIEPGGADALIVYSRDGRWGFLGSSGPVEIAAAFERAGPFGRDIALAPARRDGRWGYVDRNGEFAITPRFDQARSFYSAPVAAAKSGERWGLIDAGGEWVVAPRFDQAPYPSSEMPFPVQVDGRWGYMTTDGRMVIEPLFSSNTRATTFSEGLVNVEVDGRMGYVDESGRVVIEPQYDVASPVVQGIATVQRDGACGYIDRRGELLVPLGKYHICHHFFGPLARVAQMVKIRGVNHPQWGYIDRTGREVVPVGLDGADVFHDGLAAVEKDGAGGYIDGSGQYVIALGHNGIAGGRAFASGLAPAATGRGPRWGYVDASGEWVIKAQFKDAQPFRGELAFVELEKSVGYVNRQGALVITVDLDEIAQ